VGSGAMAALAAPACAVNVGGVRVGERRSSDDLPAVLTYTRVMARDARDLHALVASEPGLAAAQAGTQWRSSARELPGAQAASFALAAISPPPSMLVDATTGSLAPAASTLITSSLAPTPAPPATPPTPTTRTVADLEQVSAATGAAGGRGVHHRLRKIQEMVVALAYEETRLFDGLDHIEATALQRLPPPVTVDGVRWVASESPPPEELMEALKGPRTRRTAAPIAAVLVGGVSRGDDDAAESDHDGDGNGGDGGGKKIKGGKKISKGGKDAASGRGPGKAPTKLKAAVKAAQKRGLGPIARAAGLDTGTGSSTGAGESGWGTAKAGVRRRPPPAPEAMDAIRTKVLIDWRLQSATIEAEVAPKVVTKEGSKGRSTRGSKSQRRDSEGLPSITPSKTRKSSVQGLTSRPDVRGDEGAGSGGARTATWRRSSEPSLMTISRNSIGTQAALV